MPTSTVPDSAAPPRRKRYSGTLSGSTPTWAARRPSTPAATGPAPPSRPRPRPGPLGALRSAARALVVRPQRTRSATVAGGVRRGRESNRGPAALRPGPPGPRPALLGEHPRRPTDPAHPDRAVAVAGGVEPIKDPRMRDDYEAHAPRRAQSTVGGSSAWLVVDVDRRASHPVVVQGDHPVVARRRRPRRPGLVLTEFEVGLVPPDLRVLRTCR